MEGELMRWGLLPVNPGPGRSRDPWIAGSHPTGPSTLLAPAIWRHSGTTSTIQKQFEGEISTSIQNLVEYLRLRPEMKSLPRYRKASLTEQVQNDCPIKGIHLPAGSRSDCY